jgi:hypothetical protein
MLSLFLPRTAVGEAELIVGDGDEISTDRRNRQ